MWERSRRDFHAAMVEIEEVDAGGSSSGARSGAAYAPTHDTRILVYPIYLNSKVTLQGGRRLAQKFCVEHPSLQEIMDVLGHLGFEYQIEDKIYPRNITQRGRIRVKLFEPGTKEPVVADITSRMELLKRIGAEIPNLKSRKEGKSGVPKTDAPTSSAAQMAVAAQMAARDQQMAAMAAQAAAEQAAGGAGGSSKKGKGKKKGK